MSEPSDKELTDAEKGASQPADRRQRMRRALTERFSPLALTIQDDSARHHGHAGAAPGGQTHYAVTIVASAFAGQSRVARQRAVMEALAGEFATGLHALQIAARTPEEAGAGVSG
jgi:BolA protein